ncbi:membrane protease YdiL (CAAX protease family) [Paenibacillus shirakamiensis]|uniref:Membrane protease YdiL (CAAX protease family) n=1 Tax=Paenibacillus shirakamiensis TaxID=1265935 RepID=A0ABS4JEA0_9BACL|nr:type II CAAX endopeptidase family protein [Paenibacillus shirakamiensis]MBP2000049.1 membrane protease YdiL (CAAX protease family) [Paenibacillus shirakamiensis]
MKAWGIMLARVAVVIGLYFGWFFTVTTLFFDYVYPRSTWFERNTVTVIILNDMVGLPLMLLAWRLLFKENLFKAAQFRLMNGKSVAIALWIGLGAGLFTVAFSRLPAIASDKYKFRELFDYLNRAEWYVFLIFLILGNIYKETLFRGILMNEFRRVLPVWVAIIIQGVLYGALFFLGDIPLSLYGFLGAVIFALLYVWFKSIWAPITAQIACQGSQYVLWHYGPQTTEVSLMYAWMILAVGIITAGIFLAVKHRPSASEPVMTKGVTSA